MPLIFILQIHFVSVFPLICKYIESESVKPQKVLLSFQWIGMMCGGGELSNRLGRQPNAVHHLGDDHLIIRSALLGVAAGLLALHNDRVYQSKYRKGQFEPVVAQIWAKWTKSVN